MNHLGESLRAEMSNSLRTELESVFRKMSLEIEQTEKDLRATMEFLFQDISQLEAEIKPGHEAWEKTKETLLCKIEAARKTERYNCEAEKRSMVFAIKGEREKREEELKQIKRLENENKLIQEQLEKVDDDDALAEKERDQIMKDFFTQERLSNETVHKVVNGILRAAGLKQTVLAQLMLPRLGKPEKVSFQEMEMELEEDPSLQLLEESFKQKGRELRAHMSKQEEEIRDAHLTEKRNLKIKMRKELERIQVKELKLAKEREERKKRDEEDKEEHGVEERQCRKGRFIFW